MLDNNLSTISNAALLNEELTNIKSHIEVLLVVLPVIIALSIVLIYRLHWTVQRHHNLDSPASRRKEEGDGIALDCVVCLNQVNHGQEYKILPDCGHGFHEQCIDAWLLRNSTCPLCRCPVPRAIPMQYGNYIMMGSDQGHIQVCDVVASYVLGFLDHFRAWMVNPISPEMMSDLGKDCLSFM